MSPAAIRCVLHLSANLIMAHFCAARACAGSLLNLSDYSMTRDELPLPLEARALFHAIRWMHPLYPSSPFRGSSGLGVPTGIVAAVKACPQSVVCDRGVSFRRTRASGHTLTP
jgi:hypothetical protein